MYESYEVLKIKEQSGIQAARQELDFRKAHRERISLPGLENTALYMVLTEEMKIRLHSIAQLYQRLERNQKVKEILLLDAYHSATIEGARTTVEQVRKVYHNPRSKDDKMVVNTIHGMQYAYENPIGMDNIRCLWEMVTKDVCENAHLAGELFRDGMVYVGSGAEIIHTPARPEAIEGYMEALFSFFRESTGSVWLKAAVFHFYFAYIHPFCDGNGRMARILTQSCLYHSGLKKVTYLPLSRVINERLSGYYRTLREAEVVHKNGEAWLDITPFLDYFLEVAEAGMITSMKEDRPLGENERILLGKMQKRGKGAEINRAMAARILGRSEETAGKALNVLVEKEYLDKIRRGRKYIFILR